MPDDLQRRWVDLYDAELAQLDDALSALPGILRDAGRMTDTVIVVTAEHGERLFEHGLVGHCQGPDAAVVHTPLILCGRGVAAGRRFSQIVRSVDIYRTLASMFGATPPQDFQGVDLAPLIHGDREFPELSAFSSYQGVHHALRDGWFKLHMWPGSRRTLYDLRSDRREQHDLSTAVPGKLLQLEQKMCRWLDGEGALPRSSPRPLRAT